MDADSDDLILRSLADGRASSVGMSVTVLCGPARIHAQVLSRHDVPAFGQRMDDHPSIVCTLAMSAPGR